MKITLLSFAFIFSVVSAAPAFAAKMNSETQNDVIARLDRILDQMERTDSSWVGTNLRMADLLAERGRLRFMNEIEANCKGCKGSVADRKRAIKIYESVQSLLKPEDQGVILFQLAHLYDMEGHQDKAQALFERIVAAKKGLYEEGLVTQAQVGIADIYFQRNNNKEAIKHYEIAYLDKTAENRGLTLYRIAWCQFNLDQLDTSIKTLEKLMQSPDILTKVTGGTTEYDAAFHGDVARDLATFYSRRNISSKDIARFKSLIPKDQRKPLLLAFAEEASRVGQKKASYEIYSAYMAEPSISKEERTSGFVHLAQTKYDMGQSAQSTDDFAIAASDFKEAGCTDKETCEETKKNMRKYVLEIHRANKTHPTLATLKAYFIYVKTFPEDAEMAVLGGQLALDLKQNGMAVTMYTSAVNSNDLKFREAALLGEVDAAERMKDLRSRETAYLNYLSVMPNGPKAFTIRYQLAQLSADRKDWSKAADQFRVLALDQAGPMDLRRKSADLALDSLGTLKRDRDIQTWATEFATALPEGGGDFRRIGRKASMNQVVQVANSDRSSKSDFKAALVQLQAMDLRGASETDKLEHYRNAAILAQKAGDDQSLNQALDEMLAMNLSAAEREETLARKITIYERRLDFRSALVLAKRMKFPRLGRGERELRLGTLSDLAGLDPRPYYEAALIAGIASSEAASVRSRLVLISKTPVKELKKQKELIRDKNLMSETLLVVYARTRDLKGLAVFLNDPRLARTQAVRFIKKQPFYIEASKFDRAIVQMKLNPRTDKLLAKSIKDRIKALNDADKLLKQALAMNDFTAEVMTLNTVSRENDRLTMDLMSLPLPKKLKPEEQKQFQALLRQQAMPYFAKSKAAQSKLAEFWNHETVVAGLIADYNKARPEVRALLENEMRILAALAPNSSAKDRLESAERDVAPSNQELMAARQAVKDNPSDVSNLEKLKILETKCGHFVMASYLEARLGQMHRGEI